MKRLERFGKGAYFNPSRFGRSADEEASSIVWLANHTGPQDGLPADASLRKAVQSYEAHDYQTTFELFLHPSWLQTPRREPFDSAAYEDLL